MNRHRRALQLIAEARPAVLDDAPDRPVPQFLEQHGLEQHGLDQHLLDQRLLDQHRPEPSGPARHAPRPGRRLVLAGLVPTVAAALVAGAAIVAVSASNPPAESPPTAQSARPAQPVTARGILLTAAEKTAATAPATGDYWVRKVELHHLYDVGGYHVLGRTELEEWHALRAGGEVVSVIRWLGAAPATEADRAAWRAAGSPTAWRLTGPEGKQSGGRDLPAAAGGRKVSVLRGAGFAIGSGGTPLTYAQVRALPSDAGKLEAYLVELDRKATGSGGPQQPDAVARWRVEMLFSQSWELLSELPVTPAVRAATYRMLAGLPGLTVTENVRDAKGRTGAGISYAYRNSDGSSAETQLIIDPGSGALLAYQQGTGSTLLLGARLSDATPPRS